MPEECARFAEVGRHAVDGATVCRREVLYEVLLENESVSELVWSKIVEFGSRDINVAGGAAFRCAAREQEDVARSYQIPAELMPRERRGADQVTNKKERMTNAEQIKSIEDGFEFRGKTYRSLSAVAREATGTTWNGLLFFHVIPYAKQEKKAA